MITNELVEEVVAAVWECGELSKEQIEETWGVTEEGYKELQKSVLKKDDNIEKGSKHIGGFVVRKRKGKLPEEATSEQFLLRTEWEKQAVARLSELLQHSQLEDLLGVLLQTVRQVRRTETGIDRRGTKAELATALVLQHGIDLFRAKDVRKAVGNAAHVEVPDRWHPGKPAAIDFVTATDFPGELVGLPTEDGFPDYELLEGRFALKPLREFQMEVKTGLDEVLGEAGRRAIVTLPTGGGKTRVAVESIRDRLTSIYDYTTRAANNATVLWLAHTEELCEQACACFKQVWAASDNICPLLLVRFWGKYTQDLARHRDTLRQVLSHPGVLVSTPQRMMNLLDGRIEGAAATLQDLRGSLGTLLIDEAHRAAAPSYQRILVGLVPDDRRISVVGLTATPFRMEYIGDDPEEGTRELKDIFHDLIEPLKILGENPRLRLQEMGVLARPVFEIIATPTTMTVTGAPTDNRFTDEDAERIDRILAVQTDNTPRRLAILERIVPIAKEETSSVLYFGPSVRDAECMAYLLRREGIPTAVVTGHTRDVTRRQVIAEFKQQKIRVLCNCEVLTTGFDAPRVTHVVMARPTVSRVLYEQIVGRGLRGREFGGTETCVILDCEDNFRGTRPELGYEVFRRVWET